MTTQPGLPPAPSTAHPSLCGKRGEMTRIESGQNGPMMRRAPTRQCGWRVRILDGGLEVFALSYSSSVRARWRSLVIPSCTWVNIHSATRPRNAVGSVAQTRALSLSAAAITNLHWPALSEASTQKWDRKWGRTRCILLLWRTCSRSHRNYKTGNRSRITSRVEGPVRAHQPRR